MVEGVVSLGRDVGPGLGWADGSPAVHVPRAGVTVEMRSGVTGLRALQSALGGAVGADDEGRIPGSGISRRRIL